MTITTYEITTTSGSTYELEISEGHALLTGTGSAGSISVEAERATVLPLIGKRYYFAGVLTSRVVSVIVY